MRLENLIKLGHVVGSFERVVVVRLLTERQPGGVKLVPPFAIAHAHSTPIVALQQKHGTIEGKSCGSPRHTADNFAGEINDRHHGAPAAGAAGSSLEAVRSPVRQ